jgi:hypothetical protein
MYRNAGAESHNLPIAIRQLLYLPTTGPSPRESLCIICREAIAPDQPSATHQCCGTAICKACFLGYVLRRTWDAKTAPDCPYCARPILRPHPYTHAEVIMVATSIELVRQCVGDLVFYAKPLNARQQGDLLTDEQAMMMLDPEGKHPRAQQQYEEIKAHRAAGWRVFCFKEATPSTFLVAEGWKSLDQSASDMSNMHPAFRAAAVANRAQSANEAVTNVTATTDVEYKSTRIRGSHDESSSASKNLSKPRILKRFWHAVIEPARNGFKADGLKLAYAGGC